MTGDECSDPGGHDPGEESAGPPRVDPWVQAESARILDEARHQAAEIIRQAQAEADHLRSAQQTRDRELLAAIGERMVSMGDAYREAMIGARKAVEQMAELAQRATATSYPPPSGAKDGSAETPKGPREAPAVPQSPSE
jgi:hypothetical protein